MSEPTIITMLRLDYEAGLHDAPNPPNDSCPLCCPVCELEKGGGE